MNFFKKSVPAEGPRLDRTPDKANPRQGSKYVGDVATGTGFVTVLEESMSRGVIDGEYIFETAGVGPEIKKGSRVHFRARKTELQWEVFFLRLASSEEEGSGRKEDCQAKTFVGQVIGLREDAVILKYGKSERDVQVVPGALEALGYMPWKGDFLKAKVAFDPLDTVCRAGRVVSLEPTLRKAVVGLLRRESSGLLSIDGYIYFDESVWQGPIRPNGGDCVRAVAVEWKDKDGPFNWRAISAKPSNFQAYASGSKGSKLRSEAEGTWSGPLLKLMNDKFGVKIQPSKAISFGAVKIGSSLTKTVEIHNTAYAVIRLLSVKVQGDQSVCSFRIMYEGDEGTLSIEPEGKLDVQIECFPSLIGRNRELCIFDFGDFRIGRYLTVIGLSVDEKLLNGMKDLGVTERVWKPTRADETISKIVEENSRQIVRAAQPVRVPFFLQKRIKMQIVPKEMWKIIQKKDEEELVRQYPGVAQELNIQNYVEKFEVSLWLEEMHNDMLRRQYDLERIVLRPSGDFFTFDAPGLSDYHPPILIGDPISVYDNGDANHIKYEAYVQDIRGDTVTAKFNPQFGQVYDGTYVTVEFRLGRTTFKRAHHAVAQAVEYLGEEWLFPGPEVHCKPPRIIFVEEDEVNESSLEKIPVPERPKIMSLFRKNHPASYGYGRGCSFQATCRNSSRRVASMKGPFVSDTRGPEARTMNLSWCNTMLNKEQKDAVRRVLRGQARPWPYIIFGPPGTGKTVTVVEAIIQVYKLDINSRTLVVAPSNSAADVIAKHLVSSKQFSPGDFVRLVGFLRLDAQLHESIREFCSAGENLDVVARHRLIVCTCTTAGQFFNLGLNTGHFTHVFIDEAGYCTEPDALIPSILVTLDKAGQVILAGDPKQLGPVLISEVAGKMGLDVSFLERLMKLPLYSRQEEKFPLEKYNPMVLTKLVKNYRAHPTLLKLPSKLFYDDELESAVAEENTNLCHTLDFMKVKGVPLLFHGVQGRSSRDPDSPSWFNTAEVIEVVGYVRKLRAQGVSMEDIGIVTPYRKQVDKLKRALEAGLLASPAQIPKVGSVEEFQGGERKVMIMSLVRSVAERYLDKITDRLTFVFSAKRFNVAITRAKAVLIVIGNPHMLHQDPNWSAFLRYCIELGSYTGCDLPLELDSAAMAYLESLEPDRRPLVKQVQYDSDGEVIESEDEEDEEE